VAQFGTQHDLWPRLLGIAFSWFDIASYTVGVLVGVFVDKLVLDPLGT
jgi:hypothetical protein